MLDWQGKTWIKIISLVLIIAFLTYDIAWATDFTPIQKKQYASRSLFKNKKVDQNSISSQNESKLNNIKDALSHKDHKSRGGSMTLPYNNLYIKEIASIYIPDTIGKVVDSYTSPDSKGTIIHIQDLHTNPEASFNLASILEILIKDYNLNLVCSEGASGAVDTSSVSSFPDPGVREKVAKVFVNSGELTGEEYLSITKYPNLAIWGIEDEDIYFQHIIEFNKIMKFSPDALAFINQVKVALDRLKPEIYSKELLDIDAKEIEYQESKIDTAKYLEYLLDSASLIRSRDRSKNISEQGAEDKKILFERSREPTTEAESRTTNYKNIAIFRESLVAEKTIDQQKIMQESQDILLSLRTILKEKDNRYELNTLLAKASLFKDKKISPFSFYSYLKELALRHELLCSRPGLEHSNFTAYINYLTKVNSLDSTKLFNEIEELTYEIKDLISDNPNQKLLTKSLRNIKFLESFFNLKVSNEELDYYLKDKESFKESWFKSVVDVLDSASMANSSDRSNSIGTQYSSSGHENISWGESREDSVIDKNLPELESFYQIAHKRDVAMFNNIRPGLDFAKAKPRPGLIAALITGGFHTQGITKLLKEQGYSYVVISPYSKTQIDEENYRDLLAGKRKPLSELLTGLSNTLRIVIGFAPVLFIERYNKKVIAAGGLGKPIDPLAPRFRDALNLVVEGKTGSRTSVAATAAQSTARVSLSATVAPAFVLLEPTTTTGVVNTITEMFPIEPINVTAVGHIETVTVSTNAFTISSEFDFMSPASTALVSLLEPTEPSVVMNMANAGIGTRALAGHDVYGGDMRLATPHKRPAKAIHSPAQKHIASIFTIVLAGSLALTTGIASADNGGTIPLNIIAVPLIVGIGMLLVRYFLMRQKSHYRSLTNKAQAEELARLQKQLDGISKHPINPPGLLISSGFIFAFGVIIIPLILKGLFGIDMPDWVPYFNIVTVPLALFLSGLAVSIQHTLDLLNNTLQIRAGPQQLDTLTMLKCQVVSIFGSLFTKKSQSLIDKFAESGNIKHNSQTHIAYYDQKDKSIHIRQVALSQYKDYIQNLIYIKEKTQQVLDLPKIPNEIISYIVMILAIAPVIGLNLVVAANKFARELVKVSNAKPLGIIGLLTAGIYMLIFYAMIVNPWLKSAYRELDTVLKVIIYWLPLFSIIMFVGTLKLISKINPKKNPAGTIHLDIGKKWLLLDTVRKKIIVRRIISAARESERVLLRGADDVERLKEIYYSVLEEDASLLDKLFVGPEDLTYNLAPRISAKIEALKNKDGDKGYVNLNELFNVVIDKDILVKASGDKNFNAIKGGLYGPALLRELRQGLVFLLNLYGSLQNGASEKLVLKENAIKVLKDAERIMVCRYKGILVAGIITCLRRGSRWEDAPKKYSDLAEEDVTFLKDRRKGEEVTLFCFWIFSRALHLMSKIFKGIGPETIRAVKDYAKHLEDIFGIKIVICAYSRAGEFKKFEEKIMAKNGFEDKFMKEFERKWRGIEDFPYVVVEDTTKDKYTADFDQLFMYFRWLRENGYDLDNPQKYFGLFLLRYGAYKDKEENERQGFLVFDSTIRFHAGNALNSGMVPVIGPVIKDSREEDLDAGKSNVSVYYRKIAWHEENIERVIHNDRFSNPISFDWAAFRRGEGTPLKVIAGAFIDGEQNALLSDPDAIKGRHIIIKNADISNPRDFILLELIIGMLKDYGAKVTVSGLKLAYHDIPEGRPHAVILQGIIDRLSKGTQNFKKVSETRHAASKPDQVLCLGAQKQGLAKSLAEKFNINYAEVSAKPANDVWPIVALPVIPKNVKCVMLVADSASDEDLLKIELTVELLKANGVKEVSIVEPYIRCSRQHHFEVNKTGQVGSNSFKTFLDIFDGFAEGDFRISALYGANIHAIKYDDKTGKPIMAVERYAGDIDIIDIDVLPEIARYFVQKFSLGSRKLFVMATDKGSNFYAENVVKFLKTSGLDAEFVYAKKIRKSETDVVFEGIFRNRAGIETKVSLDELEGADVLVVDDELRTGGTLRKLCTLLMKDLKAGRVFVGFTHGIFSLGPEESKKIFSDLLGQGWIAASNSIVSVTENNAVLPEKINIDSYIAEKIYSHFLTSRTVRVGI